MIRLARSLLFIARIDQDRQTAGSPPGLHVSPAVAHHEALFYVDSAFSRRLQDHAWFWLSASAVVGIRMKADLDVVHSELGSKELMYSLNGGPRGTPGRYIRLVRDDDD